MANKIETAISKAQQHEAQHHSMENEIVARYQKLHRSIKIVDREKVQALLSFTHRYINLVPKLIAMASVCAEQTHIIKYVGPFIKAAEQFFFMPLEGNLHDQESLPTLLEEAYLAHRLLKKPMNF